HGGDGEGGEDGDGLGCRGLLRHAVGGPDTQVLGGRGGAGGEGDERGGHLAGVHVRTAHGLRGGDLRVYEQCVLDDRRVDVVTAPDDQVLGSGDEGGDAGPLEPCEGAGVQPA